MNKPLFKIEQYSFCSNGVVDLQENHFAKNKWPVVYLLSGGKKKQAYIGESTNVIARMTTHLSDEVKSELNSLQLISSDKFNKSAALDIESNLIRYLAVDGQFKLLNSNRGIANHSYYQKNEVYKDIFKKIWDELHVQGTVKNTLEFLQNSDIFKYSPYKVLSLSQESCLINILEGVLASDINQIIVNGGAGTGKTILAVYLFKLLLSNDDFYSSELEADNSSTLKLVLSRFKAQYPDPKIALVVPVSSFRATLKKVFSSIEGLRSNMVISPSEATNMSYDLILVDESHRLRQRVNLGAYYGGFDRVSKKLDLDKNSCSELDWILYSSNKTVFFYDKGQSIKPSDISHDAFENLSNHPTSKFSNLNLQIRVKGGNKYTEFINDLFNVSVSDPTKFSHSEYDFIMYESLEELVDEIKWCNDQYGLARVVAGYAWPWKSKKDKSYFDIEIGNVKLKWNSTALDWVNSQNSVNEVGCIHTTQGYDLNYTGVIFGPEISFDPIKNEIVIIKDNYFDKNGKHSIRDPAILKNYVINIYKTILLRGIKGTYLYVCDPELRKYLSQHISVKSIEKQMIPAAPEILPIETVKPFVNAIPLYDIKAAAGGFSKQQSAEDVDWIALPEGHQPSEDLFACYVVGDSMNKMIPNGSLCLFKANPGGSRNGKIVLVQHRDIQDPDHGGTYTVKTYHSEKIEEDGVLVNQRIVLKPETNAGCYSPIVINNDDEELAVVGQYLCNLTA